MKFLTVFILVKLFSNSIEASTYCSKFDVYLYVADIVQPSKIYYTLNATLDIAPGPGSSTNFSVSNVVEHNNTETWSIRSFQFHIGPNDGYTCILDSGKNCTTIIQDLSKNTGISDQSAVVLNPPIGKTGYAARIILPAFYRGASFDQVAGYFYSYSNFSTSLAIGNWTSLNRTVYVQTSCAGMGQGNDWKYNSNLGSCNKLQVLLEVRNSSGIQTQDFGCLNYQNTTSGSYFYSVVKFQPVASVFPNAATNWFLNGLTSNVTSASEVVFILTGRIPVNEPLFWFVDYMISDAQSKVIAETSGAISLVLICDKPDGCSNATDIQFYTYDQSNSLYNSAYVSNATLYPALFNLYARVEVQCNAQCSGNFTIQTTTPSSAMHSKITCFSTFLMTLFIFMFNFF